MTDLTRLKVSLTKHGAHKIAWLLHKFDKDEVLDNLSGSILGINIEHAQASTNLSVAPNGVVPSVWNDAKAMGDEAVNALVLIAIVFSHHRLISAMIDSSSGGSYKGTIIRGTYFDGKAYTNIAHILDELGFAVSHSESQVSYDFSKLFQIKGLHKLVQKILYIKLDSAGWDKGNSVVDECVSLDFHRVFSMSEQEFRNWLVNGDTADFEYPASTFEDEDFFIGDTDEVGSGYFSFSPGHNRKKEGTVSVRQAAKPTTSRLLHNEIQNNLYEYLALHYGEKNVSTENDTGSGTSVDVVLKDGSDFTFYEIKTAGTVKRCIRQALPQLLEYAYWPDQERASRLVVVSHLPTNAIAETYLATLRDRFRLPIFYEQFSLAKMALVSVTVSP